MRHSSEQTALLTPPLIHQQESFVAFCAQPWGLWVELQPSDRWPATQPKAHSARKTLPLIHTEHASNDTEQQIR